MKTINKRALALVLVLCVGARTFVALASRDSKSRLKNPVAASGPRYVSVSPRERLKGYRKWARVNPKPLYLDHSTAALCTIASPEQVRISEKDNPHNRKYFTVYVNPVGQKAMMRAAKPVFPVGSIIIKEKLPSQKSKVPELLTVMVKHPKGYDDENGNWEYLVLNGTASKVQGRGRLANCQSCHAFRKDSDYVFRTYLPDKVYEGLR